MLTFTSLMGELTALGQKFPLSSSHQIYAGVRTLVLAAYGTTKADNGRSRTTRFPDLTYAQPACQGQLALASVRLSAARTYFKSPKWSDCIMERGMDKDRMAKEAAAKTAAEKKAAEAKSAAGGKSYGAPGQSQGSGYGTKDPMKK
jgi:hypothetical protein